VDRVVGVPGGAVSILNNDPATLIPIVSINNNSLPSEVVASETEVVEVERVVGIEDLVEVSRDPTVEANLVTSMAAQVTAETVKTRVPLFENNGLGLNVTDSLGDDPLGHLLQHDQALLNYLDALCTANKLVFWLDEHLIMTRSIEVINTIEVVEIVERRDTPPVIEGANVTSSQVGAMGKWASEGRSSQGGEDSEFSEHGVVGEGRF